MKHHCCLSDSLWGVSGFFFFFVPFSLFLSPSVSVSLSTCFLCFLFGWVFVVVVACLFCCLSLFLSACLHVSILGLCVCVFICSRLSSLFFCWSVCLCLPLPLSLPIPPSLSLSLSLCLSSCLSFCFSVLSPYCPTCAPFFCLSKKGWNRASSSMCMLYICFLVYYALNPFAAVREWVFAKLIHVSTSVRV